MQRFPRLAMTYTAVALTAVSVGACARHHDYQTETSSYSSSSSSHYDSRQMSMAKPDADMQKVLDAQASLGPKPIETLSVARARKQPSPADGVKKIVRQMGKNPNDPMGVTTKNIMVSGAAGQIPARLYWPKDAKPGEKLPVVVYYHGGGWVIATNDTYDATPRALAKQVKALVVSVEYRKAPEHRFPAAHDDAFAAYKWTLHNAAKYNGDAKRIAVVGESAGGNLAINTAIKARDAGIQMPKYEGLIYPVAGTDMNTASYSENANAKPLNKAMMGWFVRNVIRSDADKLDPRLDLIGHADLHGLPPTTIITAQIDPLRSDGELLADKLEKSNVQVDYQTYEGATHEFFGMAPVVGDAKDAQSILVRDLTQALDL